MFCTRLTSFSDCLTVISDDFTRVDRSAQSIRRYYRDILAPSEYRENIGNCVCGREARAYHTYILFWIINVALLQPVTANSRYVCYIPILQDAPNRLDISTKSAPLPLQSHAIFRLRIMRNSPSSRTSNATQYIA